MRIPLAKTGIYACGVSQQTGVASAKPGTAKQENSRLVDLYRFLLADDMSTLFTKVNKIETEEYISFSMGSPLFELVVGSSNMPMTPDCGLPTVIAVDTGRVGMALIATGRIAYMNNPPDWFVQYTKAYEGLFDHPEMRGYIEDIAHEDSVENADYLRQLKKDFARALKNNEQMIYYYVG